MCAFLVCIDGANRLANGKTSVPSGKMKVPGSVRVPAREPLCFVRYDVVLFACNAVGMVVFFACNAVGMYRLNSCVVYLALDVTRVRFIFPRVRGCSSIVACNEGDTVGTCTTVC